MAASFPTSIKTFTTKTDDLDYPLAEHINSPQDEIVALETLLGANGRSWIGEGQMKNGFIQVSVATSDLTVQIRTIAGTAPSASDPVYVRINNTVRKITSALSVTKNDGTNWCNAGGAELATKEVDYFVYLGYNAIDGVVIGFSRIPYARNYNDFSATTTNDRYCAISTITNAAAGDDYVNIGRFAATLSAGAGYTWSVPTFTTKNLIQHPIYNTRLLTWQPAYTNLTVGNGTTVAGYQITGNRCQFQNQLTLGSTSSISGAVSHSLPIAASSTYNAIGTCRLSDTGTAFYEGMIKVSGTTVVIYAKNSAGTYLSQATISATVPMTWVATDVIDTYIDYLLE